MNAEAQVSNNDSSDLAILRAVQKLDSKLSDALTKQTATLTASIQALADRHHESLLEQEKRNATFADRDRVEAVAEHPTTSPTTSSRSPARVSTESRSAWSSSTA